MIANPDNRHKKREREKTGSGHPQPHCALLRNKEMIKMTLDQSQALIRLPSKLTSVLRRAKIL